MTLIDVSNPSCPGAVAWWKPSCIEEAKACKAFKDYDWWLWQLTFNDVLAYTDTFHAQSHEFLYQIPTCTVSWFSTQIFSMHRWKTTEFRSRNTFLCIPLFSVANESKAPLPAAAWIWRHISNYIVLTETDRPPALLAVLASLAGSCYQGDRVAGSLTARSEAAAVARGRSYQGPGRSSGRGRDPPSHSGPLIAASSRNRCSFAPSCEAAASRVLERLCSTSFGARQSFKRKTIWFGWFSDSSGLNPPPRLRSKQSG